MMRMRWGKGAQKSRKAPQHLGEERTRMKNVGEDSSWWSERYGEGH